MQTVTDISTDERKAADKAEYDREWGATSKEGPAAAELVELCITHADKMWSEGWYTTARALYLAAEKIGELSRATEG